MRLVNQIKPYWLKVICGGMFSRKTESLLVEKSRAEIGGKKVLVFKPIQDNRSGNDNLNTHDQNELEAIPVKKASDILEIVEQSSHVDMIMIDEAQFMDMEIVKVCKTLARRYQVVIAGLDQTFEGKPFGLMPELMIEAEMVIKLNAVCERCGSDYALRSRRKTEETDEVAIGGKDKYEALCRHCSDI